MNCACCKRGPLIPYERWVAGDRDSLRHAARGLCAVCYGKTKRDGTLLDYPRAGYSRAELVADVAALRAQGLTRKQMAERLGMRTGTFDQAYRRAVRAGAL